MPKNFSATVAIAAMASPAGASERVTLSLDGTWEVAEGISPTDMPERYDHRAPVPALTHSATPGFPGIDEFQTPEYQVVRGLIGLPREDRAYDGPAGTAAHPRNYFWYRTSFEAPSPRAAATLEVRKAQFGSEVWVNGVRVGGNDSGFTAAHYDIAKAIRWSGRNDVLIRIGANPNMLPPGNTAIFDFEKVKWTPGIWDSVLVHFNDSASIVSTQVAPQIEPRQIVVQTKLRNTTGASLSFAFSHIVRARADGTVIAEISQPVSLIAGEERTITETIALPGAELWSQETPNLYMLETSTGGDNNSVRFGMREFRFDTLTRRAYLNGKPIFLRGGNICLHRFFDDENAGTLPWQDDWVRKLLGPIPRKMSWNTVKFTIGPVPQKWLDIADEEGLLVLYEFPLWTLYPDATQGYTKSLDVDALREEYRSWLSDNWNHPSIVYWAASLESKLPAEQSSDIIAEMRKLDLSGRPWGNSWNAPQGPHDPHEYKQYLSIDPTFDMTQLESGSGVRRASYDPPTGHTGLITEFDWLWLHRDGTPTPYTKALWEKLSKPGAPIEDRFKTQAYLLAGQIEYWRAHRNYAGVIYLSYLSEGWVVDNFRDVENLKFQPYYEEFVGNAFKPLGVYLNFWQPALEIGAARKFDIMMVNDEDGPTTGVLSLILEDAEGKVVGRASRPYEIEAYGQMTYPLTLSLPEVEGEVTLSATAIPAGAEAEDTTVSRRFFKLVAKGGLADLHPSPEATKSVEAGGQFDVER